MNPSHAELTQATPSFICCSIIRSEIYLAVVDWIRTCKLVSLFIQYNFTLIKRKRSSWIKKLKIENLNPHFEQWVNVVTKADLERENETVESITAVVSDSNWLKGSIRALNHFIKSLWNAQLYLWFFLEIFQIALYLMGKLKCMFWGRKLWYLVKWHDSVVLWDLHNPSNLTTS